MPCPSASLWPGAVAFSGGVWLVAMETPPPQSAPSRHQHRSVYALRPLVTGAGGERDHTPGCKTSPWAFPVGRGPPALLPGSRWGGAATGAFLSVPPAAPWRPGGDGGDSAPPAGAGKGTPLQGSAVVLGHGKG